MTCETCEHSKTKTINLREGLICCRFPPQLLTIPHQTIQGMQIAIQPMYPSVEKTDICGEYLTNEKNGLKLVS